MKFNSKFISESEDATVQAARELASGLKAGDVVALYGPLGAGKSVFARALIRALAGNESLEVPSPTFTLLQTYESPAGPVNHYDFYRLNAPEEAFALGWEDSLSESITIVEWPEKLGRMLPVCRTDIHIAPVKNDNNSREIAIHAAG